MDKLSFFSEIQPGTVVITLLSRPVANSKLFSAQSSIDCRLPSVDFFIAILSCIHTKVSNTFETQPEHFCLFRNWSGWLSLKMYIFQTLEFSIPYFSFTDKYYR